MFKIMNIKRLLFGILNKILKLWIGIPLSTYKGALSNRSFDSMSSVLFWMIDGLEKKYSDFKIKGKKVVEIGSGVFFSHPLALKLLGSEKVFSFDLYKQYNKTAAKISFNQRIMSKKFFTSKKSYKIFIKKKIYYKANGYRWRQ